MANKISEKVVMKQLNKIDFKKIGEMLKQFDKNFQTLSENQVYMQENQLEFEQYLKAILKNQENISKKLEGLLKESRKYFKEIRGKPKDDKDTNTEDNNP